MQKTTVFVSIFTGITLLSGCGMLSKKISSTDSYRQKASEAIGVSPKEVKIINVHSELKDINTVHFVAKTRGRTYYCSYDSLVVMDSGAICNSADAPTTSTSKSCNALLKAAGRCH